MKKISRKKFIKQISILPIAFSGIYNMMLAAESSINIINDKKPLVDGKDGILKIIKGFDYKVISKQNQIMSDGLPVPNHADGMMSFKGENGRIILIRNHEIGNFYKLFTLEFDLRQYLISPTIIFKYVINTYFYSINKISLKND